MFTAEENKRLINARRLAGVMAFAGGIVFIGALMYFGHCCKSKQMSRQNILMSYAGISAGFAFLISG